MGIRQVIAGAFAVPIVVCIAQATPQNDRPQIAAEGGPAGRTAGAPIIDDIVFTGLRRIAPGAVKAQIACVVGEALDDRTIASDVRALGRAGWFASVRVEAEDPAPISGVSGEAPRRVRLRFSFEEHLFLTNVEYAGSRLLSRQQIAKLIAEKNLAPRLGEPENPVTLHQIAGAIQSALADLGHPDARVRIQRAESSNRTIGVRFEIADGPHLIVGRVRFDGEPGVSAKVLRRQMQRIKPGTLLGSLRGKNSYTREAFEEDRERLLAYYQNHGYPEARIGPARVSKYEEASRRWLPWPRKTTPVRLEVGIPVAAGPIYRIASVKSGEALEQALTNGKKPPAVLAEAEPGRPYSARAIENLRRAWQVRVEPKARRNEVSSFPNNVEAIRTLDSASRTVRVRLDLSPAPPYLVRHLEFRGMHHFPDRYFRSRILLSEGAPFDDRALEAGLARLARSGYFKPIKKEDVHVETNEAAHTADVTIRVEELGQQRASLVGGRGQFGSTLGIAYTVFNLVDREELLSSRIEGGPESLQLAVGFAKEGFLGSRGSLALSVFNTFLRPRLSGSAKGPFFKQESKGVDTAWSYALTNTDSLSTNYELLHSKTQYSPTIPAGVTALSAGGVRTETSSRSAGFGWTHDTGDERIVLADSVSGGWLGGSEHVVRSKAEYGRTFRDAIFDHQNAWALRTSFTGVGSYSGDLPFYTRLFAGDDFVRGLRAGELGPDALVSSVSSAGTAKYSASPAGADLVGAANLEYRWRLSGSTEAAAFFDFGSGMLLPNWLGRTRPALIDSTNRILHASSGMQLQWTVPGIGVPVRAYYGLNLLRLDRWLPMPDRSSFHAHDRFSAFGWALGALF
jgi:outer membrane protein assembly complex protein YaeT